MESPTAEDDVKGLKRTLKEQKKQVQKSILANDVKRSDYDRLRARSAQAKSSLATAEEKLAAAETMLKNAREFSGTIAGSCTQKSSATARRTRSGSRRFASRTIWCWRSKAP